MDVVPRRYTKTNYEIVDVEYKAPVASRSQSWLDRIVYWKLACSPAHLCLTG